MWVVIGDFNEIMFSHDRGNIRPHAYMHAFRDSLEDCELVDIGFKGYVLPGNVADTSQTYL
jgi:hypothetical protein